MTATAKRTEKLDLRLTPDAKRILQMAAAADRRSVSDFVLHSAMSKAEEILPDRTRFGLSAEKWEAFLKALDAPYEPAPELIKLLREPSVFDKPSE